jgi:hypothetical protein
MHVRERRISMSPVRRVPVSVDSGIVASASGSSVRRKAHCTKKRKTPNGVNFEIRRKSLIRKGERSGRPGEKEQIHLSKSVCRGSFGCRSHVAARLPGGGSDWSARFRPRPVSARLRTPFARVRASPHSQPGYGIGSLREKDTSFRACVREGAPPTSLPFVILTVVYLFKASMAALYVAIDDMSSLREDGLRLHGVL